MATSNSNTMLLQVVNPMVFISAHDINEASHQILAKLRGTYTYHCPVHEYAFEHWIDDKSFFKFERQDLALQAHGKTVIESRYPTLNQHGHLPSVDSEVSIVTDIHLHRKDGLRRTITEIYIVRLERQQQGRERFTVWRPKQRAAGRVMPVSSLQAEDLERLGVLELRVGRVLGTELQQRQHVCLEMRRTNIEMDAAEDYAQPWNLFKICLHIGPGVARDIAGKRAGFEIRRCDPYVTSTDGRYDWLDGRVEVFTPADETTLAKWSGVQACSTNFTRGRDKADAEGGTRKDSLMSSPHEEVGTGHKSMDTQVEVDKMHLTLLE